jgi:hypothetical protein
MKPDAKRSAVIKFWVMNLLISLGYGGAVYVVFYAIVPLRVEKMEVVYRAEGLPFATGPEGMPPEQWQRMSAVQLEIVEPMADMLLYVAATAGVLLLIIQLNLLRLKPHITGEPAEETSDDSPAIPFIH